MSHLNRIVAAMALLTALQLAGGCTGPSINLSHGGASPHPRTCVTFVPIGKAPDAGAFVELDSGPSFADILGHIFNKTKLKAYFSRHPRDFERLVISVHIEDEATLSVRDLVVGIDVIASLAREAAPDADVEIFVASRELRRAKSNTE